MAKPRLPSKQQKVDQVSGGDFVHVIRNFDWLFNKAKTVQTNNKIFVRKQNELNLIVIKVGELK